MQLIDRIGSALLLEPLTLGDMESMLSEPRGTIRREVLHLIDSGMVLRKPHYCDTMYSLTRRGRDWATAGIQGE